MGRGFGFVSRKGLTVKRVTGASGCEPGAKASGKRQAAGDGLCEEPELCQKETSVAGGLFVYIILNSHYLAQNVFLYFPMQTLKCAY